MCFNCTERPSDAAEVRLKIAGFYTKVVRSDPSRLEVRSSGFPTSCAASHQAVVRWHSRIGNARSPYGPCEALSGGPVVSCTLGVPFAAGFPCHILCFMLEQIFRLLIFVPSEPGRTRTMSLRSLSRAKSRPTTPKPPLYSLASGTRRPAHSSDQRQPLLQRRRRGTRWWREFRESRRPIRRCLHR